LTLALAIALAASTSLPAVVQAAPAAVQAQSTIDTAIKLAHWQLARLADTSHISQATGETANTRGWERAVFWVGMTELADHGGGADIRDAVLKMGAANGWMPGSRPYHADDLAITQSYLWAAQHGGGAGAAAPTKKAFDFILSHPPRVSLAYYQPPKGSRSACNAGAGAMRCSWRRPR
jgi:rhamnogalacturonyl hydrolase YesR